MAEKDIFLKGIQVDKVRHLKDLTIPISDNERTHLILTGKNGSGKSSLLEAIKLDLSLLPECHSKEPNPNSFKNKLNQTDQRAENALVADIIVDDEKELSKSVLSGDFIVASFNAQRPENKSAKIKEYLIPYGPRKIEFNEFYSINESVKEYFIQYLVNLKTQRSFARDENKEEKVQIIDDWFLLFENLLKSIFDDSYLKLKFDSENFVFFIEQQGRNKFDFNSLADGYSAILNIVTELMLRMEQTKSKNYDVQGIVLIDEIETHLHIDLQKKILPFLTKFFPKIQFIVSTHSPFVLNSLSNAVIYDLENHILVEDLSGYSVDGIIEGYFNADKYSAELKKQVVEYETLLNKKSINKVEEQRVSYLTQHFNDLSKFMAPELQLKLQQLNLQKL